MFLRAILSSPKYLCVILSLPKDLCVSLCKFINFKIITIIASLPVIPSLFSTFELTKSDDGNEEEITGMA